MLIEMKKNTFFLQSTRMPNCPTGSDSHNRHVHKYTIPGRDPTQSDYCQILPFVEWSSGSTLKRSARLTRGGSPLRFFVGTVHT